MSITAVPTQPKTQQQQAAGQPPDTPKIYVLRLLGQYATAMRTSPAINPVTAIEWAEWENKFTTLKQNEIAALPN
jgi:hypothetical protein